MSTLVQLRDLSLTLGGRTLFDRFSLQLHRGDRIGLVGPNGSGKSSLLRVLAGQVDPDAGRIEGRAGLRLGFLPQEVTDVGNDPLLDLVVNSVEAWSRVREEIEVHNSHFEKLQQAREADPDALLMAAQRIADSHESMAALEAAFSPHEAKKILGGLGFDESDFERPMSEFSGGWKMRGVLASLLFQRPDLLLLDEPTNHLDMPSVAWLSGFLERYDQAFVLVSHDREFLNEQVTHLVSFEPEGIKAFRGNYEQYLARRGEERQVLENRAKNLERERAHLQQFIDRFRAKASKAAQVQSRIRALEKLEQVELHRDARRVRFQFPTAPRGPRIPVRTDHLSKAFGSHVVLDDVRVHVERGDRIAIVGPNGAGKTTLLRLLAGELDPTAGQVQVGERTEVRYYAQHHAEALEPSRTVYEEVIQESDQTTHEAARGVLGALLFQGEAIDKRISVLSGGERARVALAKILVHPGNVLLMDEPTNHLDLETSESLTAALRTFDGTLVFVSHNRAFIRELATRLWVVDGGDVEAFVGDFDDYLWSCRDRGVTSILDGDPTARVAPRGDRGGRKRREAEERAIRSKKLGPLRRRTDELEARIDELERAQGERSEELSKPELYADHARRDRLLEEFGGAQTELEEALEEWSSVQSELDAARNELGD